MRSSQHSHQLSFTVGSVFTRLLLPASIASVLVVGFQPTTTTITRSRVVRHTTRIRSPIQPPSSSYTFLQASSSTSSTATASAPSAALTVSEVQASVDQLKKVLEREYLSFFDPMERDYYADTVTFDDPLTQLEGVDGYQSNVDMLAGRNLFGSLLFRDAGIALHSVTGGQVTQNTDGRIEIGAITTRWTLRFTFKALPWQPTPRFSGISRYTVVPGGPKGVQVLKQADYWDSINLVSGGGDYQPVDKSVALGHFLDQIKPGTWEAPSAGLELPYQTLRIGRGGYEVRRYPSFTAVQMPYERRDEAFTALGEFTRGMNPMAPAIVSVGPDEKTMMWPLSYALPGQDAPPPVDAAAKAADSSSSFRIVTVPERVVAVQRFSGSIVEPVVRRVDGELRESLQRDGLVVAAATSNEDAAVRLEFAQYDAVHSMGQRRSEVHIPLQDGGHPW